ncbi:hypothetical protein C8J36_10625 [Rhizobium sp. PP-F2F-G48]|uniref:hypothetical protein n=1 Tax=Rhizobium sp. PP-F2F-G48 TaxID=2135651 RepID=UPI00104710D5|nr:hypothetical protein [Rhizobium sp. PP-F2F-G48]TCM53578.1 hypothetical protein C8J36_10625 [Rhizobium sp. PP-F2F-G48]
MERHFWRITGHSGMDQIFERIVPVDSLSDAAVCLLLQCLVAREVDINALIDGLGQPGTAGAGPLDVRREPGPPVHYRLAEADVVFEASVMAERPASFADARNAGLAA